MEAGPNDFDLRRGAMYYKRGRHGYTYYWSQSHGWTRSTATLSKIIGGGWVLSQPKAQRAPRDDYLADR